MDKGIDTIMKKANMDTHPAVEYIISELYGATSKIARYKTKLARVQALMEKYRDEKRFDMADAIMNALDDKKIALEEYRAENKRLIEMCREQDKRHGNPADHKWVDLCPDCAEGTCGCAAPDECGFDEETQECGFANCDCWLDDIEEFRDIVVKPEYSDLFEVLRDALNQAQVGKGEERHGNGLSFMEQPILTITRAVGLGFPLGQAMKKIQECQRMDADAAKRELLGAINYLAAAVLFFDD